MTLSETKFAFLEEDCRRLFGPDTDLFACASAA